MSDSLERLYLAVIAAKDLDPATSRTARLFQRGPAQMAKKLAEEAIEVVIDAVNGNTPAGVRVARDAAARASARNCREAAEIGCENGKGDAPGCPATNCRA